MCKSCQYCMETCYWHLIEKRFCYDEDIALYEAPEKDEKNNNTFENMAFYDSVAVIAGRAIVTIDPLPPRSASPRGVRDAVVVQQPRRRMLALPQRQHEREERPPKEAPAGDEPDYALKPPEEPLRKKSLRDRRLSKSLHLKIDHPKEIPVIRQHSMPKFYLDTPENNQTSSSILCGPSSTLTSPVPPSANCNGFVYDLYAVVCMEKARVQNLNHAPVHNKDDPFRFSRLSQIKDKIKLRRAKSSLSPITNLPHSHHI